MAGFYDENHAMGALLGGAVGDALGTTLEFTSPQPQPWNAPVAGPHTTIIGQGPFHVVKGQVTDDTQMAVSLASSLASKGYFDATDAADRYAAWAGKAFDIGGQTRGSLSAHRDGKKAGGKHFWVGGGRKAAGNGSLMRTWPIGVFHAHEKVARRAASILDSAITHFDPKCLLACAAYNAAIARAVDGAPMTRADVWQAAMDELPKAARFCRHRWPQFDAEITAAERALAFDLKMAVEPDPHLYGEWDARHGDEAEIHMIGMQGFVRVAFRLAFWQLMHAASFKSGLLDTVNRGGDADTNGAIVGALLGAFFGQTGIPVEWTEAVLNAEPTGAWAKSGSYHPARFLDIAERTEEEPEDPADDIVAHDDGSTRRERAEQM